MSAVVYRRDSIDPLYDSFSAMPEDEVDIWLTEQGGLNKDPVYDPLFTQQYTPPLAVPPSQTTSAVSSPTSCSDSDDSDSDSDADSDSDYAMHDSGFTHTGCFQEQKWTVEGSFCVKVQQNAPAPAVPEVPQASSSFSAVQAPAFVLTQAAPRLVLPAPVSPRSRPTISYDLADDSEADAEGSSNGDATDDEYQPDPEPAPQSRKRVRSISPSSSVDSEESLTSHPRRPTIKRQRAAPASRNIQVARTEPYPTSTSSGSSSAPAPRYKSGEFICPDCGWEQKNKRMPDFKRHLKTHTRPTDDEPEKGWWCKGVLYDDAQHHKFSFDAEPYSFLGKMRIGGCRRTFSRRDALKRHLDNYNVDCIGRPVSATEE